MPVAACRLEWPLVPSRPALLASLAGLLSGARGRVLWFCWLGWVFDFHDLILFSFSKRVIAAELQIEGGALAWIAGAGLFASAVGGYAFGRFADRHGRRRAMSTSILVYSLGALLTACASGPWTLLVARACAGLGVGGEWGIGHAVIAETFDGRDRDRAHGLLQAGSPLAMALAACTGLFLAPVVGWRIVFALSALPALLVFLARRAMPGLDRPPSVATELATAGGLTARPHRRASCVLFVILLLHMTGFWCVYAELPAALMRDLRATPGDAGAFQLVVNSAHLLADVAFGVLASKFGRGRVFVAFCVFAVVTQLLMALSWNVLAQDLVWFTAAAFATGLSAGTWSCFGAWFGMHYPPHLRATAAAFLYSTSRGAQLFAKPGSHALSEWFGSMQPALWVGAACAGLSALMVPFLPRVAVPKLSAAAATERSR